MSREPRTLVCFRDGLPLDEVLTRIDEELIPVRTRQNTIKELSNDLRNEVFRYFPKEKAALDPLWSESRFRDVERFGSAFWLEVKEHAP